MTTGPPPHERDTLTLSMLPVPNSVPSWVRLGVRPGVHVGPSVHVPGEQGLHVGRAGAPMFALLAVLCGEWREEDVEPSDYAFAVGDGLVIAPPEPVCVHDFAWTAANERPRSCSAAVVGWFEASEVVQGAPKSARVVYYALHAARALKAGQEITFHYGSEYACVRARKGYSVGEPAVVLKERVPRSETPAAVFGAHVRRDAFVMQ